MWEMITDDLVRTIAYFLPNTHLTPSGIWHLASVCSTSRNALKDWLLEYKKIVMQARQLCAKVGGTSGGVAASQVLHWQRKQIDVADMTTLANISHSGSLPNLTTLFLHNNLIGDAGMIEFSRAIASGSLANLTTLNLWDNQIGDSGMIAFAEALKPTPNFPMGSLRSPMHLFLNNNQIGDAGMIEFSRSIASGSLPKCIAILVSGNPGNAAPLKAACEERGIHVYSEYSLDTRSSQ